MVITFFDYHVMMYTHICPTKSTVKVQYYIAVLKQLIVDQIPKKQPDLVRKWKLYHINVQPRVAHIVTVFLTKKKKCSLGTAPSLHSESGSQRFLLLLLHEKGAEREAFLNQNGHHKGFRGDSQVYDKMRLPEYILRVAAMLEKMRNIAR